MVRLKSLYEDADELVVLGAGNSGLEEGLFLTKFAKHVTVLEQSDKVAGSKILHNKVSAHPKMDLRLNSTVASFNPDSNRRLESLTVTGPDGETYDQPAAAAFVFIGLDPNTGWLNGLVDLDQRGFIVTDRMMQTSVLGIFAAGDVRAGSTKQLASAVGEGAAVSLQIRHHLESEQRK